MDTKVSKNVFQFFTKFGDFFVGLFVLYHTIISKKVVQFIAFLL